MKIALRAGDKERLGTLRLILAGIKQREIDEGTELDDAQVLASMDKMLKQRRDAIAQYESAGRLDLAEKERNEVAVIQSYFPAALDADEINEQIDKAISKTGAQSMKDMGSVIAELRPHLQGRADMALVSAQVKKRLGGS